MMKKPLTALFAISLALACATGHAAELATTATVAAVLADPLFTALAAQHLQLIADRPELLAPLATGLVVNASNLKIINQAFNAAFKEAFNGVKPLWNKVAMQVPSTTAEEKYGWLGSTTRFREWIGDRQYQNLRLHDYTIKNKPFENTVMVPATAIKDDQYGVYSPLMSQLGQDAALHPDELIFALLAASWTTPCYDGQYMIDTDHPVGPAGAEVSVSNHGGGSGTPWYLIDNTKVVKPLIWQTREPYRFVSLTDDTDENVFKRNEFVYGADGRGNVGFGLWQLLYGSKQTLDIDNYAAARAAMMSFKSDAGKPLGVMPKLLVVGPSGEKAALNITQAERLANGQDNVYKGTAEVLVVPWLA